MPALLVALVAACGKSVTPPAAALRPPEAFNFASQPIIFSPPPVPWEAEGQLSGGIVGVRYVKRGSVGEGIGIGSYTRVSGGFTLPDVIERVIFKPEQSPDATKYRNLGRRDIQVAGQAAVLLDLTLDLPEGRRFLRKVYVAHNDHLFVAEFIGLEASLPLFDQVVASITFPS